MLGMAQRKAYFLVRQHGALRGELVGRRRRLGRIDTGVVYQQQLRVTHSDGRSMLVRRITVELNEPTRDGDTEIHLLTNLPPKFDGRKVAVAYLSRWQIEAAFQKLTQVLRCELNTLGYPPAALFGFCLAVVMYNALNTVIVALQTAHSQDVDGPRKGGKGRAVFLLLCGRRNCWRVARDGVGDRSAEMDHHLCSTIAPADGQNPALAGEEDQDRRLSRQLLQEQATQKTQADHPRRPRFDVSDSSGTKT